MSKRILVVEDQPDNRQINPLSQAERVAYSLMSCPEDGACRGLHRVKWAAMLPSVGIHFKSTDALLSPVLLSNSGGDL